MLAHDELFLKINSLIEEGDDSSLEELLLQAYSDSRAARKSEDLQFAVTELATFYSTSKRRDLGKAEAYYLELEQVAPGAQSKWMTAGFYFVLGNHKRVVNKVNEIDPDGPDKLCYYSALTLKGQSCICLGLLGDAEEVLDKLISLANTERIALPYGDEMNFLTAGIEVEHLAPKCRILLETVVPRIRDQEYRNRGNLLMKNGPRRAVDPSSDPG